MPVFGNITCLMKIIRENDGKIMYIGLSCWSVFIILLSISIGVSDTVGAFEGYVSYENYNWLMFPLVLPFSYFLVRFVLHKIVPHPIENAPILTSIHDKEEKHNAAIYLESKALGNKTLFYALILTLIVNIADFWNSPGQYYWEQLVNDNSLDTVLDMVPIHETDWSFWFLVTENKSKMSPILNLLFVLIVYTQQFLAIFFGFLILVLFAMHNAAFLGMIYQRRWSTSSMPHKKIVIDLLDQADLCFGLKNSRQVFNLQVLVTSIIACILLASRFANVKEFDLVAISSLSGGFTDRDYEKVIQAFFQIPFEQLFPDLGQVLIPICWLILFFIVFMPALIKILPAIPCPWKHLKLVPYLREFLPNGAWSEGRWEFDEPPTREQEKIIVNEVAAKFAENSFWPNGDNTARFIFFIAIYVFLILIFPLKYSSGEAAEFVIFYFGIGVCAFIITGVIFYGIKYYLYFVSSHLVKKKK